VERADVVVVGAGIVGACTAAAIARHGRDVTVLERSGEVRATGSSRGTARFRQLENHPDASFLDLGVRARRAWSALEPAADAPIFHRTGNLSFGDPDALGTFAAELRARGLPCEVVTGHEVHERWNVLRARGEDVLFQPDGEVIAADVGYAAALRVAERRGARFRRGVAATALSPRRHEVEIRTGDGVIRARQAVLAAGPWVAPLARTAGIDLPVEVTRQTVAWFAWHHEPPPTLTQWTGREPYLLWDPAGGLKVAEHARGPSTEPDDTTGPETASVARLRSWLDETLSAPLGDPITVETCLYTNAPDDRFLIEREGDVVAVSACSGHAFQYAPAIGEDVAAVLADPSTRERVGG
jgi:sarcosine oxidase